MSHELITAAILTLSDKGSRGEREDLGGPLIREMIKTIGAEVLYYEIIPDEKELIKEKLIEYSKSVDLLITTGGTGLSPRDVAPDATREVIEREIPGIAEAMRMAGLKKTNRAMLRPRRTLTKTSSSPMKTLMKTMMALPNSNGMTVIMASREDEGEEEVRRITLTITTTLAVRPP